MFQAIAGPNLKFFNIVAQYAGGTYDSTAFRASRVYVRFVDREIEGSLLADSAYPASRFVFTPVLNPQNRAEELYNRAHRKARNVIERAFGNWKRRFSCLRGGLVNNFQTVSHIIVACAVLHNITIEANDAMPEDDGIEIPQEEEEEEPEPGDPIHGQLLEGIAARQALINQYFQIERE